MKKFGQKRRPPSRKHKATSGTRRRADVILEHSRPEVFISYSREDRAFVAHLIQRLSDLGRPAWVDLNDVKPTEEWRNAIYAGIDAAPNFVFVISPNSIVSIV